VKPLQLLVHDPGEVVIVTGRGGHSREGPVFFSGIEGGWLGDPIEMVGL